MRVEVKCSTHARGPGGGTPILGHGKGGSVGFSIRLVPILYLNTIRLTPLSAEKIGLSLSHLVLNILGPKVGLICHQHVFLKRF